MISWRSHNPTARLSCRCIAAIQLLVMLLLAVPATGYGLDADHGAKKPGISASTGAVDADHDSCPCCPDTGETDSSDESCSTCNACSLYAPLSGVLSLRYLSLVGELVVAEPLVRLPDVHLPIFVPPQNLV